MQSKKVEVLGHAISNGKGVQLNLDIAKLHTRTKIQVPIIVERGKKEGPTLLITASNSVTVIFAVALSPTPAINFTSL